MHLPSLNKLSFNQDFKQALTDMTCSEQHLLITGHAGTGKSTLLEFFRHYYPQLLVHQGQIDQFLASQQQNNAQKNKNNDKNQVKPPLMAVVAPTGVAALNIGGETIHSFFWFKPAIGVEEAKRNAYKMRKKTKQLKLYQKLDTLIIDEISMVRADLLDCIDQFLKKIHKSIYQPSSQTIERKSIGSFTQMPVRLAWAVTIHKAQGQSFDQLIIDVDRIFASGQTYVALSRATQFKGLYLARPLRKKDIWLDWRVVKFLTNLQYQLADLEQKPTSKHDLLEQAIEQQTKVSIAYLKGKNVKSKRTISPSSISKQTYAGHQFMAVEAYCHLRKAERVFSLKRILSVKLE